MMIDARPLRTDREAIGTQASNSGHVGPFSPIVAQRRRQAQAQSGEEIVIGASFGEPTAGRQAACSLNDDTIIFLSSS